MTDIGIVGAGTAGLHLGLLLRRHDIPVTIYTDRSADDVRGGRLPNSVAHHAVTVAREQELGVDHWPVEEYGYGCHHHFVGGPNLFYRGDFVSPSRAVDYRIYQPALMGDFEDRGGRIEIRSVEADDLGSLAARHDAIIVASGKRSLGEFFGIRAEKSPYAKPMRRLMVGLWTGVARTEPHGVTLSIAPGHGELIDIPIYSFAGHVNALLFENVPGGDTEVLADARYEDDPEAFRRLVLDKLRMHHPTVFERVDESAFQLTSTQDLLQGAVTPVLRNDYRVLDDGTVVIAAGDVHSVLDPVVGQGANSASYSGYTVGEEILEDRGFGEDLGRRAAERRRERIEAVSDWTNLMVQLPPADHIIQLLGAMSQDKALCDEFTENFNHPVRQWRDVVGSPEIAAAAIARHAHEGEPAHA
ncbi:styrene monooxygenase/indole monooxygenase family protein [Microbacterium immunditiarum]|uniref:2-polyprenyl-6-methoxyphenol hydroxylase-like FAD-dependent oxidoreductase n=1 Tax=Microbacterium immunditiarum TaxID=337480 RepID=A0A7Y9GT76_9MICO|nr:styrene monooxygenase/indole monooxygenase family protein [Microbacterium immunditiarum]NYE21155.1 2-polyprenyl-6-methoxyphenol hydroxylase-like FAD-dependent oxidoreductase [Microbacterium immunditiarum]